MLEIQKGNSSKQSWFNQNRVNEDGSLYLTSSIDPMFIIIPRLVECKNVTESNADGFFVTQADIFNHTANKDLKHLQNNTNFALICDKKQNGDEMYYRLNEELALKWLRLKLDQICDHFASMSDIMIYLRAQVAGFKPTAAEVSVEDKLRLAIGFVSEYLSDDWKAKLATAAG